MGANNTRQMKFGAAEKENIGSGRSGQGHKSQNDIGQSQNLPSGRGDEQDSAADAERCKTKENLWAQSKRRQEWSQSKKRQEEEEQESFETGFQQGLGVCGGDCGFPDSSGGAVGSGGGGGGGRSVGEAGGGGVDFNDGNFFTMMGW